LLLVTLLALSIRCRFGKSRALRTSNAKTSQGGMSIAMVGAEFMQADQGGSPPNLVFDPRIGEANPSPFGTLFPHSNSHGRTER
jgi:hypothetical protein